jgi:hypothetical protein
MPHEMDENREWREDASPRQEDDAEYLTGMDHSVAECAIHRSSVDGTHIWCDNWKRGAEILDNSGSFERWNLLGTAQ